MAVENAISAGAVTFASTTALRFGDEELVAATPLMVESKPIVPLVLMGRFDEAIARGERIRAGLGERRPSRRPLAGAVRCIRWCLCHALRGDDEAADEWRTFAGVELAGEQTRNVHFQVGGMIRFVEARLALHFGRAPAAVADPPTDPDAWWQVRHWYFDAYPWAAAAELAAATGQPDAAAALARRRTGRARERLGRRRARPGPGPTHRRPG